MSEQTINPLPTAGSNFLEVLQAFLQNEDAQRLAFTMVQGVVIAGGLHATIPGLTATPSPLTALCGGFYITETGAITYPDNQTTYVIASPDTVGDLGAYTRVAGTHYLIASGVVTPALPASCIRLMDVTTAAGAISGVVDVRQSSALIARFLTPYVRLIGQEIGGVDYIIQENLGNLLISINTRTEDHPLHTPRFTLVPTASNLTLVSTATVPRTQTFPDKAGTFAMLSDITASAFAPGTRMLFDNDTAPTGWTRVVSIDDEVVRIVSGARADGGSWTVSGLTAAGHAITVAEMPSHVHAGESGNAFGMLGGGGTATGGTLIGAAGQTAAAGGDQQHTHNVVSDGTWRPLHRDVILCSKT